MYLYQKSPRKLCTNALRLPHWGRYILARFVFFATCAIVGLKARGGYEALTGSINASVRYMRHHHGAYCQPPTVSSVVMLTAN